MKKPRDPRQQAKACTKTRVAIYRRAPKAGVEAPERIFESLEHQKGAIDDHLGRKPDAAEIAHDVSDHSALGDAPSRPGIAALLHAARRGEFEELIVSAQDRLAREMATLSPILGELETSGIKVYDATGRRISLSQPQHAKHTMLLTINR